MKQASERRQVGKTPHFAERSFVVERFGAARQIFPFQPEPRALLRAARDRMRSMHPPRRVYLEASVFGMGLTLRSTPLHKLLRYRIPNSVPLHTLQ